MIDIDDPLPTTAAAAARPEPGADAISSVVDMGFTPAQGRKALKETVRPLPLVPHLTRTEQRRFPRRRMAVLPPGRHGSRDSLHRSWSSSQGPSRLLRPPGSLQAQGVHFPQGSLRSFGTLRRPYSSGGWLVGPVQRREGCGCSRGNGEGVGRRTDEARVCLSV